MKKKNHVQKSIAKKLSWQKGGASRIAYEQRMQDKKTMDHRTSQPAAQAIGHQKPNAVVNSVLMYRAAAMLLIADADLHRDHAARLIAAADASLGADA